MIRRVSHASTAPTVQSTSIHTFLFLIILTLVTAASTSAQNSNDRGTPTDSKKGQSTQSTYARDKIETVNLANGNFSLSIPLATIGGRGSASFTLALSYNSKVWTVQSDRNGVFTGGGAQGTPRNLYSAMYDKRVPEDDEPYLSKLGGGWSLLFAPGVKLRTIGIDPLTTGCNFFTDGQPDCGFKYALTKMWVTLPDGSQLELRDVETQGTPSLTTDITDGYHNLKDIDRKRIWRSVDGSNVIFVRDTGYPVGQIGGQNEFPTGWVFLPDGTRVRMEQGVGKKIIDRNGNFITLNGNIYTDQLGRQTIISGPPLTVTVKGYMGTPDRSISVGFGTIGDLANLRSDFHSLPRPFTTGDAFRDALDNFFEHTIQGPHTDLFLNSEGSIAYGTSDGFDVGTATAVTQLNLPDGRPLRFRYNQYGEVAEIVYPGGGVSQIDYTTQGSGNCEVRAPFWFNRKVTARRTLKDNGAVDATWVYSPDSLELEGQIRPGVAVSAYQGDTNGTLLLSERHIFRALNAEYRNCGGPYTGTGNEKWENAKEMRTEISNGTGTTVTVRNWSQRAPMAWPTNNDYYIHRGQDQAQNDERVNWEETTLEDGKVKRVEYGYDQFNNVTSVKEYDFGTAGSPGGLLRQTLRTYATALNGYCYSNLNPTDPNCGSLLASDVTKIIYQPRLLLSETVKDGSDNQKSYSEFEYDSYSSAGKPPFVVNGGMIQYDGSQFVGFADATQPRGNVTRSTRWLSGGTDVVSYSQYDNAGNVVWSKDPKGYVSTAAYTDNFGSGSSPDSGVAGPSGATFAFPSLTINAVGHQVKMQYDYSLGANSGVKDPNNVITKTEYDILGRPFRVTAALGLAEQSVSQMSYPTLQENSARASKQLDATRWLSSKTDFDGFDRPIRSWQSEDGQTMSLANFTIRSDTNYDPLGRVKQVSNPYRPATEVAIYTTTGYDLAGRVTSVTTPDSAVVTTSYYANTVTVSDQMQKQRKSVTDALGRLVQVYEAPNDSSYNYLTTYGYDTLDNLTSVSQVSPQGTQTRTFVYDSLKRLKSATNPESGTVCYGTVVSNQCQADGYDANGNLVYKTDARGVRSTYAYDALNRNISIIYTNDPAGTPSVTRTYDGATSGIGKIWKTETAGTSGSRTTINSYDALGRPLSQGQQFYVSGVFGPAFTVQRTYDLAGHVKTQNYPSNHSVTYNYDGAGRLGDKDTQNLAFTGNLGDGALQTYSRGISYTPLGGLSQERFGTDTPIYNKLFYNSRGQLAEIREGVTPNDENWERGAIINFYATCWGKCGGHNSTAAMTVNNGNLRRQEIYIPGGPMFAETFEYDSLNRLQSVSEDSSLRQEYVYDRYGNRTINGDVLKTFGNGVNNIQTAVSKATNRMYGPTETDANHTQMDYDLAGNQTKDLLTTNGAATGIRTYDAENRMAISRDANGNQIAAYAYTADGQRVRRTIAGQPTAVETWFIYGLDGELLAEYAASAGSASPQKEYGYRNGQLLITAEPPTGQAPPLNVQNVSWTNVSSTIQVTGNSIQKTSGTSSWYDAGAVSTQTITSGNGYVDFVPGETGTWRMCGLGNGDTSADYADIEYAFFMVGDATLHIYESGNYRGQFGTYAASDHLKVAVENGVVKYYRNGTLLYTSTVAPQYPLLVDTSLNTVWSGVYNVVLANNVQNVTWTNVSSTIQVTGNSIQKTSGTSSWYDAGAVSTQTIASGNGYVDFVPGETGTWRMCGLGNGDTSADYADIEYAFFMVGDATLHIYESGNYRGQFGTYAASDHLKVAVENGVVKYYRNATLLYTSTVAPQYPLLVDTSLNTVWSGVYNVVITSTAPSSNGNIQWLVTDQLGTPRMVFDKTGSLAATKRHDYLPFGEELFATQGARTTAMGYDPLGSGAADKVRQKFTSKERDVETSLDYFGARYYASTQGRFTGVDPAPITVRQLLNPQDLNRYAYVANNPLKFIDPNGAEKILIVVTTFIPQPSVTAPVSGRTFEGDDRNVGDAGGFRTQQMITIETDPSKGNAEISSSRDTGITHELGPDGSYIGQAQASGESLEAAVTRGESGVFVQMKGNESDPLISGAPGITYDFHINVQSEGTQGNLTVTVGGSHDSFPGYEVTVTRIEQPKPKTTVAYGYDPRPTGRTAWSLIPGNSTTLNPPVRTVIPGQAPQPPPAPPKRKHGKRGDD